MEDTHDTIEEWTTVLLVIFLSIALSTRQRRNQNAWNAAIWAAIAANPTIPEDLFWNIGEAFASTGGSRLTEFIDGDLNTESLTWQMERVVRTETTRAVNGEMMWNALIDGGNITWNAILDEVTRDAHWALHGTTIRAGEMFELETGDRALYPGDPRLPAGQCINCRCWLTRS